MRREFVVCGDVLIDLQFGSLDRQMCKPDIDGQVLNKSFQNKQIIKAKQATVSTSAETVVLLFAFFSLSLSFIQNIVFRGKSVGHSGG